MDGDGGSIWLDTGESWVWEVTYYPTSTVTYTITGHGWDRDNHVDITYPDYPDEQKIVTVPIEDVQECAECEGKVTQLTLRYNGGDAAEIKVEQKGKDGGVVFNDVVQPGEEFTFSGMDKKGTLGTEISIYVDGILNTRIHTSCSQPIGPGLVSGDFEVIEGYSRNGGLLCPIPPVVEPVEEECAECEGKVTQLTLRYNGGDAAEIKVEQKGKDGGVVFNDVVQPGEEFTFSGMDKKGTLGTEISIYVDGILNTRIHTSCSQPIGPGLVSGDFEVIEGYSRNGGLLCPIPPVEDECRECDGKVTELTLKYNGTVEAAIRVEQKKGEVVFDGVVQPGGEFTFSGMDKKGTLGTEISIYVGDTLNTKIHTSCSQPIAIGMVFGDFEIVAGTSLKGGALP